MSQNQNPGKDKLQEQIQQSWKDYEQEEYKQLVQQLSPKPTVFKNTVMAFIVGGTICAFAQIVFNAFSASGMVEQDAGSAVVMVMVFLGALLTGLGVYDSIAKVGGAGAIVPITGFANSMVAPALEYKREGFIYGVGAKMFTVAGPVLVYGFVTSVIIGLIVFILQ